MRIIAMTAALILAAPAHAADSFYAAYIAGQDGAAPCYARSYDEKHLAEHPKQKVTHFFLTGTDVLTREPPKSFEVAFGFRLKDSTDSFSGIAGCEARADGALCFVEGDGGQFRLTPRPDGLLVTVVDFLMLEGGESFSPDLAESDDREFRLYTGPAGECGYDRGGDDSEGDPSIEPLAPSISRPE